MLCTCPLQIVNSTFSHPLIVHSDIISVSNKTIFDGCLDCGGVFILIYIVNRLLDGFPKTDFLPLTAFRVQAVKKNPSLNMSYHVHNLYIFKRGQLARRVKWQLARVLKGQELVR